ncbi:MAG: sodium:solute symporter, partial [Clostridia bacterium]|nr:sodium:solute symporter [Clostridia bacterium]
TTKAACWVSFVFGSGIMIANMLFRSAFPAFLQSPINCGAFAMLAGLVIVPVVSLFTPKGDREAVDRMFACYDKKVEVSQ